MDPQNSKKDMREKEIFSANSDQQQAAPSSANPNDGAVKSPFSVVSSESGQDSPTDAATASDGSEESPFQFYQGEPAEASDAHRLGIPKRRPEGQLSKFGPAAHRPELLKKQPKIAEAGVEPSKAIMEKVKEAGELAMQGRLDSEIAIQIIEEIRSLGDDQA